MAKKYKMVFDMGHTVDSIDFNSFEAAKADMEDTYIEWMTEECRSWECDENGIPHPTEKQIEDFDYMINEFYCVIIKYDEESEEWQDTDYGYYLPEEEKEQIGWMIFDRQKEKYNW